MDVRNKLRKKNNHKKIERKENARREQKKQTLMAINAI